MRVLGLPDEDFLFRVEEALEILPSFELSPPQGLAESEEEGMKLCLPGEDFFRRRDHYH